ncbi:hypothetical protein SAMN05421503_0369 [Terribacillus aidingensis]|uniref:Uncharacterized protein n=1 Tax=Terribacillus aidingensis TaxID=586416 RepID=A0A285N1X1_9BACI|nr:hypothetical protein SAMN05421503_0369 [Terribacillus aidingensis]
MDNGYSDACEVYKCVIKESETMTIYSRKSE